MALPYISPAPIRTPLFDPTGNLARAWLSWLTQLFASINSLADSAAPDVFSPYPWRDLAPQMQQLIEAARETPAAPWRPAAEQLETQLAAVPTPRDWHREIDELRAELAAIQGPRNWHREIEDLGTQIAAIQEPSGQIVAHAATHQNGGADEVATGTPAAYAIPKADSGGKLASGWLPAGVASQWTTGTSSYLYYSAGNVGIGAAADDGSAATLQVTGWQSINKRGEALRLRQVNAGDQGYITWYNTTPARRGYVGYGAASSTTFNLTNEDSTGSMVIATTNGFIAITPGSANVAVGSSSDNGSGCKLQVNGSVYATGLKLSGNSTGAKSAALGANCPAVTATAPYTWVQMTAADGSTVYLPAFK